MNTSGRSVAGVCIFSTLFMGCYTSTVVTSDTPQPDDKELVFTLLWMKQGSTTYVYKHREAYVISTQHHRIENGFEVTGRLVTPENKSGKAFSGVLYDDQIKEVAFSEYDGGLTAAVIVGAVVVAGVFFAVGLSNMKMQTLP